MMPGQTQPTNHQHTCTPCALDKTQSHMLKSNQNTRIRKEKERKSILIPALRHRRKSGKASVRCMTLKKKEKKKKGVQPAPKINKPA
jgi:hypothetical protein